MKKAKSGPTWTWVGYVGALIAVLSFVYLYINLTAKNTECANKVHNLELQNAELIEIRQRYLALIESLIREGKVDGKDLSASLSQKEIEMITSRTPLIKPDGLIDKIRQLQRESVRDSTGTEASQNFTDDDFTQFISERRTAEITERLQKDNDFQALLKAIKYMNSEQRTELLERALNTYRRPWSELRLNPNTASPDELRKGQTNAGTKAEKLIAQTVVDLVKRTI